MSEPSKARVLTKWDNEVGAVRVNSGVPDTCQYCVVICNSRACVNLETKFGDCSKDRTWIPESQYPVFKLLGITAVDLEAP